MRPKNLEAKRAIKRANMVRRTTRRLTSRFGALRNTFTRLGYSMSEATKALRLLKKAMLQPANNKLLAEHRRRRGK